MWIHNTTPLSCATVSRWGEKTRVVALAVKGTFQLRPGAIATLLDGGTMSGDQLATDGSLRYASDFVPEKPHADLLFDDASLPGDARGRVAFAVGRHRFSAPAGSGELGPVARDDRQAALGTHDDEWLATRWPERPADFDARYHNAAPKPQQVQQINGDERVTIEGAGEPFRSRLPALRVRCFLCAADGEIIDELNPQLDTVHIDAAQRSVALVWRARLDDTLPEGAALFVASEPLTDAPQPRALHQLALTMKRLEVSGAAPAAETPATDAVAELPAEATNDNAMDSELDRELEPAVEQVRALLRRSGAPVELVDAVTLDADLDVLVARTLDTYGISPDALEAVRQAQSGSAARTLADNRPEVERILSELGQDASMIDEWEQGLDGLYAEEEVVPEAAQVNPRAQVLARQDAGDSFEGENLEGIDLSNTDLSGASFRGAMLAGANLVGATLAGADFSHAVLTGARMQLARAPQAQFVGAEMTGVDLREADLSAANLSQARLTSANLRGASLELAVVQQANLAGADLSDAQLQHARLEQSSLENAALDRTVLRSANLDGALLDGARGEGADFRDASLQSAKVRKGAAFRAADFRGANAGQSRWSRSDMTGADFSGAQLGRADLSQAQLASARFDGADLHHAHLDGASLTDASVRGSQLMGTRLTSADLSGATLDGSNLYQSELSFTKRDGLSTDSALLEGTRLASDPPRLTTEV